MNIVKVTRYSTSREQYENSPIRCAHCGRPIRHIVQVDGVKYGVRCFVEKFGYDAQETNPAFYAFVGMQMEDLTNELIAARAASPIHAAFVRDERNRALLSRAAEMITAAVNAEVATRFLSQTADFLKAHIERGGKHAAAAQLILITKGGK